MPRLTRFVAIALCLAACHGGVDEHLEQHPLAPPLTFTPERRAMFDCTSIATDARRRMLCVLELGANGLAFAAFTTLGQPLFSLRYDSAGLEFNRGLLPPGTVEPSLLLAELQLSNWPAVDLARSVSGTPWTLEYSTHRRTLFWKGDPMIVWREDDHVQVVENHFDHTALELRSIDK
jgi:hypothetical protein